MLMLRDLTREMIYGKRNNFLMDAYRAGRY